MEIQFEWDPDKAVANLRKHGVSFETAIRAFADPLALIEQDRIEGGEQRWRTVGRVDGDLLLLVAHTAWEDDDTEAIRIISARRAEPKDRRRYEQGPR